MLVPEDISIAEVQSVLCSRSLLKFVERAWPVIEPATEYQSNWHIEVLCEHLEAVTRGEIKRLVINVPPGTMKSLTCAVFWPAWVWTHAPQTKWITASYSDGLTRRDCLRARRLLMSPWYQERWGDMWRPHMVEWTSLKYSNTQAGFRMGTTVAGAATGEHADIQLVDDPIKPLDAPGDRVQGVGIERVLSWWDETMSTRMVDPKTSRRVIIMQRLHENDLAGHVLASGGYTHLCLPMEAEKSCVVTVPHRCSMELDGKGAPTPATEISYKDKRKPGELLWPKRFPAEVLETRHTEMGPRASAAQDQQRPVPAGGGIFKREWVQYWTAKPKGGEIIQSWDMAFKGTDSSDYVVGQVWMRDGANFYLLDQWRKKATFSETCLGVLSLTAKHPRAVRKLIEDKANGSAVMDMLQSKVAGMKPVNPMGGKVARANAVEPLWAARNVFVPDPKIAPWASEFVDELVTFNGDPARHDDQVDAMTQALSFFLENSTDSYRKAISQWTSTM